MKARDATQERRPEGELIRLARQGERSAFGELFARYEAALQGLLRRLGSPEQAQDWSQDAALRAWTRFESYDESYRFATWLFRIGTNLAISELRRRRPEALEDGQAERLPGDERAPWERLADGEERDRLAAAVGRLPARWRAIVDARHRLGLELSEIADLEGSSANAIAIVLHRARERLSEELKGS